MELDQLKNAWKGSGGGKPSRDIGEILRKASAQPLDKIKKRYRRSVTAILVTSTYLIIRLSRSPSAFHNLLFWCYLAFCITVITLIVLEYRTVQRMQTSDLPVLETLQANLRALKKQMRNRVVFVRLMPVIFVTLVELLMALHLKSGMEKWYGTQPYIRLGVYAVIILLIYLMSLVSFRLKYKKHIIHLEDLIRQGR